MRHDETVTDNYIRIWWEDSTDKFTELNTVVKLEDDNTFTPVEEKEVEHTAVAILYAELKHPLIPSDRNFGASKYIRRYEDIERAKQTMLMGARMSIEKLKKLGFEGYDKFTKG